MRPVAIPVRTVAAAVLTGLTIVMSQVATAPPAVAHNRLIETEPTQDADLDAEPEAVTLTYDQEVGAQYNLVVVTGPDGEQWQDGEPEVEGESVRQELRPLGPAGDYEVSWRVVSADGHPISGTFEFTLTTPGEGSPVPESERVGDVPDGATDDADGGGVLDDAAEGDDGEDEAAGNGMSWLALAGVLVLAAVTLVAVVVGGSVVVRRRRSGAH